MAKRSLQVSLEGIKQAKQAFANKGWTQADLAREVGIKTRQPIGRFFAGQPVDRQVFIELCFLLGLNWQEIAELPKDTLGNGFSNQYLARSQTAELNLSLWDDDKIDVNVERLRSLQGEKIAHQCGTLRLLDVTFPVNLAELYVDVQILEPPIARKWLELSDWKTNSEKLLPERVSPLAALKRYKKLAILGKPGSGKTTFLQYLAIACQRGDWQDVVVPIFIRLKDFGEEIGNSETSLLEYISQELEMCGIETVEVEKLLVSGRMHILLDGWDEVSQRVWQEVSSFFQRYYKNYYAIATRTATLDYQLEGFAEIAIADFNQQQIEAFATKWFVAVAKNNQLEGIAKASEFIRQLNLPENYLIRELATTPLLLHLACLVFDSKTNFPLQRYKIYREALDILLFRWDAARGIQRNEESLAAKMNLLSNLAAITFERGDDVFELSKIQPYIAEYLHQLPDGESLELASIASVGWLKSIEGQHGLLWERSHNIYSFSHLAFQVYLTAKQIADTSLSIGASCSNQLAGETTAKCLVKPYITDKRWHEVWLIVAGMLPNADHLLQTMKQQIDELLAEDERLQQFLKWVSQKSWSFQENRKLAAVRSFYFALCCALDCYLACALNIGNLEIEFPSLPDFPLQLYLNFARSLDTNLTLTPGFQFAIEFNEQLRATESTLYPALRRLCELELILSCMLNFDLALERNLALELQNSLQQIKAKLPEEAENSSHFQIWWQNHAQTWSEELQSVLNLHRYAGHHWQFSDSQKLLLNQYYEANKLIVDCLKNNCQVTNSMQQQIEETLFLTSVYQ